MRSAREIYRNYFEYLSMFDTWNKFPFDSLSQIAKQTERRLTKIEPREGTQIFKVSISIDDISSSHRVVYR